MPLINAGYRARERRNGQVIIGQVESAIEPAVPDAAQRVIGVIIPG
jgi:hypothetical protein